MKDKAPNGSKDDVDSLFVGKWFLPIVKALDRFEDLTLPLLPEECREVATAGSAEWIFRCIWSSCLRYSDETGAAPLSEFNARRLGTVIGAKVSLCEAIEASAHVWKTLSDRGVAEVEEALGSGVVAESMKATAAICAIMPRLRDIERDAMALAAQQCLAEKVEFFEGFTTGAKFCSHLTQRLAAPRTKRHTDENKRECVNLFAVLVGPSIEQTKAESSWPELHQAFLEFVDHRVEIDEETFKKILSRAGLKGVGKPGRRPSNETRTPKKRRRP